MKNQIQIITYADRLGQGDLATLGELLDGPLQGIAGGLHLLPFFYPIDGSDAGFDPIDHRQVDPRLGGWEQVRTLGERFDLMADLIVNHVSGQSEAFQSFLQKGSQSPDAELFLTFDKVFPQGATEADLLRIYRPRPGFPFTRFKLADGSERLLWTTFTSNQIDIDVLGEQGQRYLDSILERFHKANVKLIRLDAAGYAIKRVGSSCFMIKETFDFIQNITKKANALGMKVLVEIHAHHLPQVAIAKRVDYVYDFALPVLVLDVLFNRDASNLKKWLRIAPRNCVTVLDTHDGIGIVDVAAEGARPGLIEGERLSQIVEQIHLNSEGQSRKATGAAASNLDLYQVNCTYFDALGGNQKSYLLARAIQFFCPGIPQVYYVGLLAGRNDMELLARTNVGRDINRAYFSVEEVQQSAQENLVSKLFDLMRMRNQCPAFDGDFEMLDTEDSKLSVRWTKQEHFALLEAHLETGDFRVAWGKSGNSQVFIP